MICRYKIKFISDIEQKIRKLLVNIAVAPFVGVWIEIIKSAEAQYYRQVAPFVGVWIEIARSLTVMSLSIVAPFVGVWIEIPDKPNKPLITPSLPSWECGLKSHTSIRPSCTNSGRSLRGSVD